MKHLALADPCKILNCTSELPATNMTVCNSGLYHFHDNTYQCCLMKSIVCVWICICYTLPDACPERSLYWSHFLTEEVTRDLAIHNWVIGPQYIGAIWWPISNPWLLDIPTYPVYLHWVFSIVDQIFHPPCSIGIDCFTTANIGGS